MTYLILAAVLMLNGAPIAQFDNMASCRAFTNANQPATVNGVYSCGDLFTYRK